MPSLYKDFGCSVIGHNVFRGSVIERNAPQNRVDNTLIARATLTESDKKSRSTNCNLILVGCCKNVLYTSP